MKPQTRYMSDLMMKPGLSDFLTILQSFTVCFRAKWYTPEVGKGNTVNVRCVPDVFAGNSLMYVYCSLVAPRTVGHSQVPLLMEIPVKTPRREVENVFYEPRSPQLVPVSSADTDEVEIDIRRGDGQPFLFRSGTVSVTVELLEL